MEVKGTPPEPYKVILFDAAGQRVRSLPRHPGALIYRDPDRDAHTQPGCRRLGRSRGGAPRRKTRTSNERYDPGGGGINVARVVQELGGSALAVYLGGGATGSVLDELLDVHRIPRRRVPIRDHTRMSHAVFERASGLEYRFVPEGPQVTEDEWRACLSTLDDLAFDWLLRAGACLEAYRRLSLRSPGRSSQASTFYPRHLGRGRAGSSLSAGGLLLVKPSSGRARQSVVGRPLPEPGDQEAATGDLVRSGAVEVLATTIGHRPPAPCFRPEVRMLFVSVLPAFRRGAQLGRAIVFSGPWHWRLHKVRPPGWPSRGVLRPERQRFTPRHSALSS